MERFFLFFFVTAAGPLRRSPHHQGTNIKPLKSIHRRRPASCSRSLTTLTTWPGRESEERALVNQNLSMFYHHASEWVIKGDPCLVPSFRREAAHGQMTLFFLSPHARARAVLTTQAKVLSQSKVSKFIPHARIYVTHLCPRGSLACFQTPAWCRLDPGPRCSLPCPCLSTLGTNKRDGTNGTERLVQEADVRHHHPPAFVSSSSLPSHTLWHLHPHPSISGRLRPATKVAPRPNWEWWEMD